MPESPAQHGRLIEATCRENQNALSAAFARAFEENVHVSIKDGAKDSTDDIIERYRGPGLVLIFELNVGIGFGVIPARSGIVPSQFFENQSSRSKLLAGLLAESMFPNDFEVRQIRGAVVADCAGQFQRAAIPIDARSFEINLIRSNLKGSMSFFWPAPGGRSLPVETAASSMDATSAGGGVTSPPLDACQRPDANAPAPSAGNSQSTVRKSPQKRINYSTLEEGLRQLPAYSQSLLKIKVPVTVTLASAKRSVSSILDIGPGAIIQFQKSCDDALSLEVGDQLVAEGEAVKVGDKFGLWVTSIKMPEERFWSVTPDGAGDRVK